MSLILSDGIKHLEAYSSLHAEDKERHRRLALTAFENARQLTGFRFTTDTKRSFFPPFTLDEKGAKLTWLDGVRLLRLSLLKKETEVETMNHSGRMMGLGFYASDLKAKPFTEFRHDALNSDSLPMAYFLRHGERYKWAVVGEADLASKVNEKGRMAVRSWFDGGFSLDELHQRLYGAMKGDGLMTVSEAVGRLAGGL